MLYRKLPLLLILNLSLFLCPKAEGKNRIILKTGDNLEWLQQEENSVIIVNREIDLKKATFNVPKNSTLKFKRKGLLKNGTLNGNNTSLKGKVKLRCELTGSFANEDVLVSWLDYNDRASLTKQIISIFNLPKPCTLRVDRDIALDGSQRWVNYISIAGNHSVKSCCVFRVNGDVKLKDVTFSDFESYRELFIDLRDMTRPVNINIENVRFDGNWNISRFIYCPYQKFSSESNIQITNSTFSKVRNYVVQFRPACTGRITNNVIEDIGTTEFSNVVAFHLGDSDDETGRMNAMAFVIADNKFKDFKVPYNTKDDGREAHAILIYGHDNTVKGNRVVNFYSPQTGTSDTGQDSEGIYLKGGGNVVEDNYLEECIGTGPDGAITIKTFYGNNVIQRNIIKHKYGIGIQCYTPNSTIENNRIYSELQAEIGLVMLGNSGSTIVNNVFSSTGAKEYHAAITLQKCVGVTIRNNQFVNTSGVLTTYGCKDEIAFENNTVELNDMIYGSNTYYTAPFVIHDDMAEFVVKNNTIMAKGVRSSQLIEAPEGFKGAVRFNDNTLHMTDSKEVQSVITYLVRNVKTLTATQNTELSKEKKIRSVSNLNNKLTLDRK